jgi:DNA adenine methylase
LRSRPGSAGSEPPPGLQVRAIIPGRLIFPCNNIETHRSHMSKAIVDSQRKETLVTARPFIKWAGGKSQLLSEMRQYLPKLEDEKRYYEPFLGGAAMFFFLGHGNAVLSDKNEGLVELYQVVRDKVEPLIRTLEQHQLRYRENESDYYYDVRAVEPSKLSPVERAARFIFLNKTCFNGLYRVNSKDRFNVPFGRYKNPKICDAAGLRLASSALKSAEIIPADFEDAVRSAKRGDFIYFDPPYSPLSRTSNFTSYTPGGFGEKEQRDLARVVSELDRRGCNIMLSNSDTELTRSLYGGRDYRIVELMASRAINSKGNGRGKILELLVLNY